MQGDAAVIERNWQQRGLTLIFAFAVANLIGALISIVAFNWTYLATAAKLGGIGVSLIACAAIWVKRGFDRPSAVSFGIAAQILIGIWLAAAGQLYQAPGGLQDLLMRWALLGLPFALASRSQAHWCVWFAVVFLWALSPMGTILSEWLTYEQHWIVQLIGALITLAGLLARHVRGESGWLDTALAVMVAFLLVIMSGTQWTGVTMIDGLAAIILLGLAIWHFVQRNAMRTVIFLTGFAVVIFMIVFDLIDLLGGQDLLEFFVLCAFSLLATYAIVRVGLKLYEEGDGSRTANSLGVAESHTPWYLDVIAALGGILSAIFLGGFIGALIGLSVMLENVWYLICLVLGIVLWVGTMAVQPRLTGTFAKTFVGMFALGGIGLLIAGTVGTFGENDIGNEIIIGSLLAILIACASAWRTRADALFVGLMALLVIAGLATLILKVFEGFGFEQRSFIVYVTLTIIGSILAVSRFGGRLRPSLPALFFLVAFGFAFVTNLDVVSPSGGSPYLWVVDVGLLAVGSAILASRKFLLPSWPVLAACCVFAILLPEGAAAALLLLLIGYGLRNRPAFGLGAVLAAGLMLDRYFGLDATLLVVAAYMALTGLVLLALWFVSRRRVEAIA